MAITYAFSTAATLRGAGNMTRINLATNREDLGAKLQFLISAVNALQSQISAAVAASQVSALSLAFTSISNFTG